MTLRSRTAGSSLRTFFRRKRPVQIVRSSVVPILDSNPRAQEHLPAKVSENWLIAPSVALFKTHTAEDCQGPCPLHSPTDHPMRSWPLHYRDDRGIFERICEHGIGHPDPDTVSRFPDSGVHGCDGCCSREPRS